MIPRINKEITTVDLNSWGISFVHLIRWYHRIWFHHNKPNQVCTM